MHLRIVGPRLLQVSPGLRGRQSRAPANSIYNGRSPQTFWCASQLTCVLRLQIAQAMLAANHQMCSLGNTSSRFHHASTDESVGIPPRGGGVRSSMNWENVFADCFLRNNDWEILGARRSLDIPWATMLGILCALHKR
jgi:hypothetical protein